MKALDDYRRRQLACLSAVLCTGSLLLFPIAGRTSLELASERPGFDTRFALPPLSIASPMPRLIVLRDPFSPSDSAATVMLSSQQHDDPIAFTLPPNRGAARTPLEDAASQPVLVRAVITGTLSSKALIDENGRVRVIGVGDKVQGSAVLSVDASGVHLTDGRRFSVTEEGNQ